MTGAFRSVRRTFYMIFTRPGRAFTAIRSALSATLEADRHTPSHQRMADAPRACDLRTTTQASSSRHAGR